MTQRPMSALAGFALAAAAALAAPPARADLDRDLFALSVGAYDMGAFGGFNDTAVLFGGEYRPAWKPVWEIKPFVGGFVTTDGSLYGYFGLLLDWEVVDHVVLTPHAAVGAFARGDARKDLGSVLEFRTGVELTYRFDNDMRVGVNFFHLSNADTADDNPGSETVAGVFVLPLDAVFGR